MNESFSKQSEQVARRALAHSREIAAAAMIGLSPLATENIEAAEGLGGLNWKEGSEFLFEQAKTGKGEVGGFYVIQEDGAQQWVSVGAGSDTSVGFHGARDRKILREQNPEQKPYTTICHAHTHSIDAALAADLISPEAAAGIEQGEGYPPIVPPSADDLLAYSWLQEHIVDDLDLPTSDGTEFVQMAYTPDGVFYFAPASEAYLEQQFPAEFAVREQAEAAQAAAISILRDLPEDTVRLFEERMRQTYPDIWHAFSLTRFKKDLLASEENLVVQFFTHTENYFINSVVVDLLDLADEKRELITHYAELDVATTPKGVLDAQLRFTENSLTREVSEADVARLRSEYAKAGWVVTYQDSATVISGEPCASGL